MITGGKIVGSATEALDADEDSIDIEQYTLSTYDDTHPKMALLANNA